MFLLFPVYLLGVTISPPVRSDTGSIAVHVGVPEAMLGTVIGRGGVIIKDIIAETGANIRVSSSLLSATAQRRHAYFN